MPGLGREAGGKELRQHLENLCEKVSSGGKHFLPSSERKEKKGRGGN